MKTRNRKEHRKVRKKEGKKVRCREIGIGMEAGR
jgi:hypothetical protein